MKSNGSAGKNTAGEDDGKPDSSRVTPPGSVPLPLETEAFVVEYLRDHDGARAARAIGVNKDQAPAFADQLLDTPAIRERITYLHDRFVDDRIADARELRIRLTAIIRADLGNYLTWNHGDDGVYISVKRKEDVRTDLIKKINLTQKGEFSLELHDKMDAIRLLAQIDGLLTDRKNDIPEATVASETQRQRKVLEKHRNRIEMN